MSLYVRVHIKIIPWKSCILNLKNYSRVIYPWSLHFSQKSRLLFNVLYCFCISQVRISQKVNSVILRKLGYIIFCVKKDILEDFWICISVRLRVPSCETWLGICFYWALLLTFSLFFAYSNVLSFGFSWKIWAQLTATTAKKNETFYTKHV